MGDRRPDGRLKPVQPILIRGQDRPHAARPEPLPTLQTLVSADTGAQSLTVLVNQLQPGQAVPPHRHDVEEVLIVTAGCCAIRGGDIEFVARAGDAVIVPAGVTHEFRDADEAPATVIGVLASGRPRFDRL